MLEKIYTSLISSVLSEISISIVLFIFFMILKKSFRKLIASRAEVHQFEAHRILQIKNIVGFATWILFVIGLAFIWNVSFEGLSIYAASIFTVLGVGLIANWSMASNITAAIILFFFFPFRIGSRVKIMDGDNSVEGIVISLSLFSIHIKRDDKNEVYYPNNLAIQKGIVQIESGEELGKE